MYNHEKNKKILRDRFRYIGDDVRAMILNVIETNARHWYCLGGGNVSDFELYFNNEKHAEQ